MCICFCSQKAAYEVRMSDWSSDVCAADLGDGVLRVTLDRPPVNAFTGVEYRALAAALAGGREPVGCVLLSARGRLFSAGGDLADRGEDGGDAFDPELPVAALRSLWECPYRSEEHTSESSH